MSLFGGNPQPGDWVITTEPIKASFSDYLGGDDSGIKRGTRGVVVERSGWNSVKVRLDGGLFGGVTVRARPSQVRVTRRQGGVDAFVDRTSRLNAARLGVAAALLGPLLFFAVSWFIHGGTKAGLLVAVLNSVLYGAFDLLTYAISNPLHALLYLVLLSAAGRFAFA